jgi:hypothetical protein
MKEFLILHGVKLIALVSYMFLEKWLGNTKKVKANSLIDLVIDPVLGQIKRTYSNEVLSTERIDIMQTQNIKEMVSLIASGVKLGIKIADDKKVSIDDMPLLFILMQKIPAAVSDVNQIPAEFADLDPAEAVDLVAYTMSELALPEDKAKQIVQHSLKVLLEVYGLVGAIRA